VDDAQAAMAKAGMDLSPHRSREISAADAEVADLILVMTADHRSALTGEFPAAAGKLVLMSELAGGRWDVADPIGQPRPAFEATAAELARLVDAGWDRILGQAP
jgi:protein-tyrosine-phosphatase